MWPLSIPPWRFNQAHPMWFHILSRKMKENSWMIAKDPFSNCLNSAFSLSVDSVIPSDTDKDLHLLTLLSYVCICICVCTCICCCQWTLIYPLNTQCFNSWIVIIIISIHYQFEFSNSSPLLCPGCSLWSHFAAIGFLGWNIRTLAVPLLTNLPHNALQWIILERIGTR